MTPEIHSVAKRFDVKVSDLIIGEPEGKVIFITVPRGVTMTVRGYNLNFLKEIEGKIGKKFFFTIEGTLKLDLYGSNGGEVKEFLWNNVAKNIEELRINLSDPQPLVTLDDQDKNPLDLSMLQVIHKLYIRIGKYNGYWDSSKWRYDHSIPYKQPKLVLNPSFDKPKELKITDVNLSKK